MPASGFEVLKSSVPSGFGDYVVRIFPKIEDPHRHSVYKKSSGAAIVPSSIQTLAPCTRPTAALRSRLIMAQTRPQLPAHYGVNFTSTTHERPASVINPSDVTLPDGYTVLVTNAGKGIGAQTARSYAQARTSNLIITTRTGSDLDEVKAELEQITRERGSKLNVKTFASDAAKLETFTSLAMLIRNEFGLDFLINNAGSIGSLPISQRGYTTRIPKSTPSCSRSTI
jgi:hypothetical protein